MKKIRIITLLGIFAFILLVENVSAQETIFFKNSNDIIFTKDEYDYLSQFYKKADIYKMTQEQYNYEKEHEFIKHNSSNIYLKETIVYNQKGEIQSKSISRISELEYNKSAKADYGPIINPNNYYENNYQKITLNAYLQGTNYIRVILNNEWKTIPSVKAFDLIGIMWENNTFELANIQAFQYFNSGNGVESVNYGYPGTNTVYKTNGNYTGVATAQNIVNNVTSDLENSLILDGTLTGNMGFWGSYQHALSDTTILSNAHDFVFSPYGYGGVFDFGIYTKSKYDNMVGVTLNVY